MVHQSWRILLPLAKVTAWRLDHPAPVHQEIRMLVVSITIKHKKTVQTSNNCAPRSQLSLEQRSNIVQTECSCSYKKDYLFYTHYLMVVVANK